MSDPPYSRGWWDGPFATEDELPVIDDCPCNECSGECGQLTEDGELCQLCRVGLHGEDA